ncbi:hypothetical protein BDQ17DRAFT_1371154, partial [Cyathus striatus]
MDSPFQQYLAKQIQDSLEISGQNFVRQLDLLQENAYSDIVEEIFIACLPEDRNPYMSAMEAPVLLTRSAVRGGESPFYTTDMVSIYIALPDIIRGEYPEELVIQTLDRQQAAVKEWLDRSGACPLSISIYPIHDPSFPTHNNNAEAEALDVSFFMDTLRGSLLEIGLKTEDLKMLKELHITRKVQYGPEQPECQWKDIISLFSLNVPPLRFNIPTHSSDIYSTLKLGISVVGRYDNSISEESGDNITLHHLTTLSLAAPASIGVRNFSKRLHLPSIKELNIQAYKPNYRDDVFGITEEIVKSLLRIHGGCLPIQIHFKYIINDEILHALTPLGKEYSDIICPQLEGLECDNGILTGITESTLKDF